MKNYDYLIIGNGITGNFLAYHLKKINADFKICLCFDKKKIPASELNAGFFTMGSWSFLKKVYREKPWLLEILQENVESVKKLAQELNITVYDNGSFTIQDRLISDDNFDLLNKFTFLRKDELWGKLRGVSNSIDFSADPLNFLQVLKEHNKKNKVEYFEKIIKEDDQFLEQAKTVIYAVNGFSNLTDNIQAQRAQIQEIHLSQKLSTSPNIYHPKHRIYFRIIEDKLIIGGLRTLDNEKEQTSKLGINPKIQSALFDYAAKILKENFSLPLESLNVAREWSGIMGFTSQELPVVKDLSSNKYFIGGFSGHGNGFSYWLTRELVHYLYDQDNLSSHFHQFFSK